MNAISSDRLVLVLRLWATGRAAREVALEAHVSKQTATTILAAAGTVAQRQHEAAMRTAAGRAPVPSARTHCVHGHVVKHGPPTARGGDRWVAIAVSAATGFVASVVVGAEAPAGCCPKDCAIDCDVGWVGELAERGFKHPDALAGALWLAAVEGNRARATRIGIAYPTMETIAAELGATRKYRDANDEAEEEPEPEDATEADAPEAMAVADDALPPPAAAPPVAIETRIDCETCVKIVARLTAHGPQRRRDILRATDLPDRAEHDCISVLRERGVLWSTGAAASTRYGVMAAVGGRAVAIAISTQHQHPPAPTLVAEALRARDEPPRDETARHLDAFSMLERYAAERISQAGECAVDWWIDALDQVLRARVEFVRAYAWDRVDKGVAPPFSPAEMQRLSQRVPDVSELVPGGRPAPSSARKYEKEKAKA